MEKKHVTKTLRQLEISELREAIGGGRLRVPGGDTDPDEPISNESDEPTAEYARLWKPG